MFFGRGISPSLFRDLKNASHHALPSITRRTETTTGKRAGPSQRPTWLRSGRRCYAKAASMRMVETQALPRLTPLNAALRSFYIKVHPDLFASHPEAQRVNEDSFKLLTEYLDLYKNEDASEKPFNFVFYLRPPERQSDELAVVRSTLTLPGKHASVQAREGMLKSNLSRLFRNCGYHNDFDVSGYGASNSRLRMARGDEVSLINLVLAASAQFNLAEAKRTSSQIRIEALKDELRAECKRIKEFILKLVDVKLSLEVPAVLFKTSLQRLEKVNEWLEKLRLVLSQMRDVDLLSAAKLQGKTVTFGYSRQGCLDTFDVVHLDITQTSDSWMETLVKIDKSTWTQAKNQLDYIRRIEKRICSVLGIARIETCPGILLRSQADYIAFLEKWQTDCATQPNLWTCSPNFKTLTVKFIERSMDSSAPDSLTGTLCLPFGLPLDDVNRFLREKGLQVIAHHNEFDRALCELKRRYGLRDIHLDLEIDSNMALECASRLLDGHALLREYLSGLNICISKEYGINEDTKMVFVKWDFLF